MYILWQWLHSINMCTVVQTKKIEIKRYVEGVKSSSIYPIRAVMLCLSKVSKEAQNGLTHSCS